MLGLASPVAYTAGSYRVSRMTSFTPGTASMASMSPYRTLAEIRLAARVRFHTTSSVSPDRACREMVWAMVSWPFCKPDR